MIDHAIVDNMIIIDIGSNDGFESSYILKKYPKISTSQFKKIVSQELVDY